MATWDGLLLIKHIRSMGIVGRQPTRCHTMVRQMGIVQRFGGICLTYILSPQSLPSSDVERILGKTPHAFITSDPTLKKSPLSTDAKRLLRDMRGKGADIERLYSRAGHIRLRGSFLDSLQWNVKLNGHARRLEDLSYKKR